jgi:hypothetical protein
MSKYWAHSENSKNQPHLLHDHLRSVGQLASQFASQMNPKLGEAPAHCTQKHSTDSGSSFNGDGEKYRTLVRLLNVRYIGWQLTDGDIPWV